MELRHKHLVVKRTEEVFDVRVNHVLVSVFYVLLDTVNRLLRTLSFTEAIACVTECTFKRWFNDVQERLLYHTISYRGYPQRAFFAVCFGDVYPSCGKWLVPLLTKQAREFADVYTEVLLERLYALPICPRTSFIALDLEEGSDERGFLVDYFVHMIGIACNSTLFLQSSCPV